MSFPDFITHDEAAGYEPRDFYRDECIHVQNVVGRYDEQETCWDIETGSPDILVGILDQPFVWHEDLPQERVVPGKDFRFATEWSEPPWLVAGDTSFEVTMDDPALASAHGMAVAGLIAASHTTDSAASLDDSTGVIGVAPGVRVVSVPTLTYRRGAELNIDTHEKIIAFLYADSIGVDVVNISWTSEFGLLDTALKVLYDHDIPIICGSGNGSISNGSGGCIPGISYPAISPYTFAVGAYNLDSADHRFHYSNCGPQLDLVAPSGDNDHVNDVWSTDFMGGPGFNFYNPGVDGTGPVCEITHDSVPNDDNYVCEFGGTSAAAPLVTGVVALLLSRDSTLSTSEVYQILRASADKVFPWQTLNPNQGSWDVGYGKLDGLRALLSITRGDVNNSGSLTIGDVTDLICYVFQSCDSAQNLIPPDKLLGDATCSGTIEMADVTYLVAHIFSGGPAPAKPCFAYNDYGSSYKITTNPGVIVSKQSVDSASSYLALETDRELHALDFTLIAQSTEFDITKLIDSVELHWSRKGDTVRVGLLDPYGQRMLRLTDTLPLLVSGQYEIVSVEATETSATGATGYFKPLFANSESEDGYAEIAVPQGWSLGLPYPNPFNPSVSFSLSVPQKSNVIISIYNVLGQRVAIVHEGALDAGESRFTWGAADMPSGLYFIRAKDSNGWSESRKAVLLK